MQEQRRGIRLPGLYHFLLDELASRRGLTGRDYLVELIRQQALADLGLSERAAEVTPTARPNGGPR